ncbi:uncharacterized protein LOC115754301 [Rhodamnia argentea]|uniref:Uncharacterized protein LOC115754301 n=1 Tax=Rhodamnia argentea TaxID=178133 RepID=A0A8B8QPM3_9MYRT|nr:uncharacterized protein LOC115754301 [Rhodamnia argentea]
MKVNSHFLFLVEQHTSKYCFFFPILLQMEHRIGGMSNTINTEIVDDFEAEIRGGDVGASRGEVELSDEVGTRVGAGLEHVGASQSEDSESDDGLYFESDVSETDDDEIDLFASTCDEHMLSRDEEGIHEVGMVTKATFAIDAGQEDTNEDENDEDIEANEDFSPPNSRDEEVCDQTRALTIRYDPNCDHKEL